MNGIGGDSFWLIYDAVHGRLLALNAAGRSAAGVDLDDVPGAFGASIAPRGGPAALTVPGTVAGWWSAHAYSRDAWAPRSHGRRSSSTRSRTRVTGSTPRRAATGHGGGRGAVRRRGAREVREHASGRSFTRTGSPRDASPSPSWRERWR